MTSVTWTGVYPALLTPFTKSDQVDIPLFLKNLGAQVDAGVDGIILGGSLGEGGSLFPGEKIDLLKRSKDFLQGAIPVGRSNIAEQTTRRGAGSRGGRFGGERRRADAPATHAVPCG